MPPTSSACALKLATNDRGFDAFAGVSVLW
jgi:hypothetical protein